MKLNKQVVAKLAALVVAVLAVYGLTKYEPIVAAVKDVFDTQVESGDPAPAPVVVPDAGL